MKAAGRKIWVIPGGNIPLESSGEEPEFLSQDRLSILNTGEAPVNIKITIYFPQTAPIVYSAIRIEGSRLRKIRLNDLIDPFPVVLGTEYSIVAESDGNVIVQFLRMDTGNKNKSIMGTIAFPGKAN
jgi:hypothetical protein